ncbi:MAG TPA: DUF4118 domain-containing protein [Casimicrobiaceae bacterium]|nr:DUF4118 domain-containing protein [Casimicrobiaceae bacterium]
MDAKRPWVGYAWALGGVVACTLAGLAMRGRFDTVNIAMVYLVAVVIVALRLSRGAAIFASALSVAAFDFLFVPPQGRFTIDDVQYLLTFAIMVIVAVVISSLVLRERREAKARASLEIAAETERIRSALLASISHDLRTPLAVMAGASSSLAERGELLPPEERRALAQSVFDQAREMSEHVAKVLEMTRLEAGAITLERDWTALPEVVSSVLSRLHERLAAHRVIVELPDNLPLVRVDAPLVEQALSNLLDNCAKHTPAGTIVRVRAQSRERDVLVTVEDYAAGLSDDELEQLFAKFHHGTVEGKGTDIGLGLAICRAIVRLHGGNAWAERGQAGGTAFRFTLPLEPMPALPEEAHPLPRTTSRELTQ